MIILLEGPDGSGKTTLGKKLAEALDYPFVHFSYPETKEEQANLFNIYRDFLKSHRNAVVDRCWTSSMVYGPIMRSSEDISEEQANTLEMCFCKNIVIIYCTGDPNILWERCQARGEDYIPNKETFMQICKAYDIELLGKDHRIPVYTWTWTGDMNG